MDTTIGAIYNSYEDKELIAKKKEYLDYINEHKNNVLISFQTLFQSLIYRDFQLDTDLFSIDELKQAIISLRDNSDIVNHDNSKYSDEEFEFYRIKFFPTTKEKSAISTDEDISRLIDDAFEEAWKHHYESNDHHPKYWIHNNKINDMSLSAIIHMICDWNAMSIKFKSSVLNWYNDKAEEEKSQLSDNSKKIVEFLLHLELLNIK